MAADTVYQQTREHLHYLGLRAVADQLAPTLDTAERSKPGYTEFLCGLLQAEVQAVEHRRLQGRLRFAKLPARKTLEQFDFSAQPKLDRRLVEDLATLRFVEEKANVLLIGPPGVGKTMLATALGHRAVEAGYRVYYTTAADLVARTAKAALEGRWANTMRFWNGPQLLIEADLVRGRTVTSWPSVRKDLVNAGAAWVDRPVVEAPPEEIVHASARRAKRSRSFFQAYARAFSFRSKGPAQRARGK